MRNGIAVALALAVFFSAMAVPFAMNDSSDAATQDVTINGIIVESGESGPVAVKDVKVTLTQESLTPGDPAITGESTTSATGEFSVNMDGVDTARVIECTFTMEGYSAFYYPTSISENETTKKLELSLAGLTPTTVDTRKVYTLVETGDLSHAIVISDTRVPAAFTVSGAGDKGLFNAQITLTNGASTYKGITNYEGVCTISKVLVGDYQIRVICDGYEMYTGNVSISKTTGQIPVTLIQKEMPTYLGMTLYHILMLFGIVIGLVLVSVAYVLCTRTWKGVDSSD